MGDHFCGVDVGGEWCDKPARFRNPFYRNISSRFSYAEWLCAKHYDVLMSFIAELKESLENGRPSL